MSGRGTETTYRAEGRYGSNALAKAIDSLCSKRIPNLYNVSYLVSTATVPPASPKSRKARSSITLELSSKKPHGRKLKSSFAGKVFFFPNLPKAILRVKRPLRMEMISSPKIFHRRAMICTAPAAPQKTRKSAMLESPSSFFDKRFRATIPPPIQLAHENPMPTNTDQAFFGLIRTVIPSDS